MKRTAYPQRAAPRAERAGRAWDFLALGAALAMATATSFLPWLMGGGETYSAPDLFLYGEGLRRVDHTLVFLPFMASLIGLVASVGATVSPADARHWKVFYVWGGGAALLYYGNFFFNKDNSLAAVGSYAGTGFYLFFAAGTLLFALGLIPRRFPALPERTRLYELMQSKRFWGVMYVLPMVVLMLVFTIYPVFESLRVSVYNWRGIGEATQFVGLRHYFTVANDPQFWNAFWNTVEYTAILVPVQLSLALILALILDNPRMRFRTFYRTLYFMPVVTTLAIVAIVMRLLYQSGGTAMTSVFVPWLLDKPVNPIGNPDTSMLAVTAFGTWYSFGINLVYFMAALATVPSQLYDAAEVDGASWFQRVWHITLPSIRPVAVIILFFAVLGSLKVWEQSFVLTGGGPFFSSEVVNGYIYRYAFGSGGLGGSASQPNIGFASAAGFLMSMLVLAITLVQLAVNRFVLNRDSGAAK